MEIRLQSVSKRFGPVRALSNISLTIAPGQIVSVLGANGAGKTTLLRCLASVAAPSDGSIFFDGELFRRDRTDLRMRLGFLPDLPILPATDTPLRYIGMVLRLYARDLSMVETRVFELLRDLDLLTLIDTPIQRLSRGQMYKVSLSAMLAVGPELLLLDEPFASGMDPNGISLIKREARQAAKNGKTVIYTTQILDIAETLSDRVCVVDRGELRYFAPLGELQSLTTAGDGGILERLFQQLRERGE